MIPTLCIECLCCSLFVLEVSEHYVKTTSKNLARYILRIRAVNLNLHVYNRLAARTCNKVVTICIAYNRSTLCSAVTNSIREFNTLQELLYFLVESSTANDNLIELATECIYNLLANLLENLLVYERHVEQQTHAIGLELRQHLFADNLLDNQGYSNDDCRFYFCECCSNDSWRRNACKIEHVTAEEEFEEEFERHAIHVRHRENTDDIIALLNVLGYGSHSKVVVAPHCAVRNHNTLRETGSARSVVDKRQLLWALLSVIMYVLLTEELRIFLTEHSVKMFASISELISTRHYERIVGDVDNAFKVGHLCLVDDCSNIVTNEEQLCFAMVYNVVNLIGCELMKNRYSYSTVGKCCEESYSPIGAITSAERNFVTTLHTTTFKHNVELFNLASYIMIL